jgi:3-oxoacyl-[acyl-carrier protein] reductase
VEDAAKALERKGVETLALALDLVTPDACERAVRETIERFGRLDVLVANAGGPKPGPVDALSDEDWRRAFELTFLTTVRLARAAIPHMAERKWGRIVIIGSGSMFAPIADLAASSGIRPGLRGFAKLLADRHAKDGITVNVVAPGLFRTERLAEIERARATAGGSGGGGAGSADTFARWAEETPIGRLGDPGELADVIAFVASARASYVTGQVWLVDGGRNRAT